MKKYQHFMLDLETLATRVDAAVTQIGLCAFDPFQVNADRTGVTVNVRPHPACYIDPKTVYWWMGQSEEARLSVFDWECAHELEVALRIVRDWLEHWRDPNAEIRIWAMPAAFDVSIYENLCRVTGTEIPWKYNSSRDLRTLMEAAGMGKADRVMPIIAHDAGADADAQALTTAMAYTRLGITE